MGWEGEIGIEYGFVVFQREVFFFSFWTGMIFSLDFFGIRVGGYCCRFFFAFVLGDLVS